ncbi:hypothetical protein [Nocardia sp. NPDC051463]|uniref:hypothetical protein n=1 Tax=Nocardia sp. NPDC051463 TaxID=3154845 RepID=UPI00345040F1
MKRSIAGVVVAAALLVPGQLVSAASASAASAPTAVADSGSGGCTSSQPPTCSSPVVGVIIGLLSALSTGSANGGTK